MTPIKSLLVATDFTDRSDRAVERAFQLRNLAGGGRLTLLHVIAAGLPPELISRRRSEAETLLSRPVGPCARQSGPSRRSSSRTTRSAPLSARL